MKIKTVELHLIKIEKIGIGLSQRKDNILINKFEVVDGQPFPNDLIPLRFYLNDFGLSPTYNNINNYFSVSYFIKFVVVDEEEKIFSKHQEIFLWRKDIEI